MVDWEKQMKAGEESLSSLWVDVWPFSLRRGELSAPSAPAQAEAGWTPYTPEPGEEKSRTTITVTRRVNMAGVCALSRRAMAIERARALGRKRVDLRAWALEQAARRWAQEMAGQK